MQNWRRRGIGTPAGWYTLVGLGLLAGSIWVPFLTAQRTARVEERADQIAAHLLEATRQLPGRLDAATDFVLAQFYCLALRDQVFVNDLEVLPPRPGTLLLLRNKHYAFHLAESPPGPNATVGRDTEPAYEVMAWPMESVGPGHSAFFHADDAPPAFTRNLTAGYTGVDKGRPQPGRSHRRPVSGVDTEAFYRSYDDERWILF